MVCVPDFREYWDDNGSDADDWGAASLPLLWWIQHVCLSDWDRAIAECSPSKRPLRERKHAYSSRD